MKKTLKTKEHLTNTDIYICFENGDYLKKCKKENFYNPPLLSGGIAIELIYQDTQSLNCYVVGLNDNIHTDIYQLKGTIVHELSHVVTFIMNRYGFIDDEFRSYLLADLYEKTMIWFDKIIKEDTK